MSFFKRQSPTEGGLLFGGFNQDATCFACGMTRGFKIFNTPSFSQSFKETTFLDDITFVEMLFESNILAVVKKSTPTKVFVWDDRQKRFLCRMNFPAQVLAVRMNRNHNVVVLPDRVVLVETWANPVMTKIPTMFNPRGLCALSVVEENSILAVPSRQKGYVRVKYLSREKEDIFIEAHKEDLQNITLSREGEFLATASTTGTLVRLWDTETGTQLTQVRRGCQSSTIYSIAFSPSSKFLAISSRNTIHIFKLDLTELRDGVLVEVPPFDGEEVEIINDPRHSRPRSLSLPEKGFRAVASFTRIIETGDNSFASYSMGCKVRTVVAFVGEDEAPLGKVLVVGQDGMHHLLTFDPVKGGECKLLDSRSFE